MKKLKPYCRDNGSHGSHEVRNTIDSQSLAILERAEDRVIEFILDDNIKPVDAVGAGNIRAKKYLPKSKLW